ncbi:DsbC family protein [Marinospirillum insulare]|uniref:Thiol:disulfide interchange protein n=1 Tax=Marinospirillum insulare TaxID=217169 RepID=A0ABQ5ZW69_9GAMM|nr:DsbC family protein [Marinospirillum insulare]GLR63283.1 thiol:disulfide interchange protein DsbC [Marinospirillum insulare]
MLKQWFTGLLLLVFAGSVAASAKDEMQARLQKIDPRIEVVKVNPAPVKDFYQVQLNSGDLLYVHKQDSYIFAGSLLEVTDAGLVDLTENARSAIRTEVIQSVAAEDQVIFSAKGETKAIVQVFTDSTCPYCSRLHEQVPELNQRGVEVRYLAFPRQGPQGNGFNDLVNVWCADDKQQAMTDAKAGKTLAQKQCDNPVAEQYELGRQLGVQGTPAIFLPSGKVIPGFVPADRLISELGL